MFLFNYQFWNERKDFVCSVKGYIWWNFLVATFAFEVMKWVKIVAVWKLKKVKCFSVKIMDVFH